jgi:hypothetical protein
MKAWRLPGGAVLIPVLFSNIFRSHEPPSERDSLIKAFLAVLEPGNVQRRDVDGLTFPLENRLRNAFPSGRSVHNSVAAEADGIEETLKSWPFS